MEKNEVIGFLKKKRVVYFATIEDGKPRVRPFSIVKIKDGKIYFFTASFKEAYKQLKKNPQAEFCIMGKDVTIRVRGNVIFEEDPRVVNTFLNKNERYLELYEGRIDDLKLFYLEHAEVHIFEMDKLFEKTIFFAFNL